MKVPALLPRQPLIGLALAAPIGIALADWFPMPLIVPWILAVVLGVVLWRRPGAWLCRAWVAVAFATLHSTHYQHGAEANLARQVQGRMLPADAEGVVWSEPEATTGRRGDLLANFTLKIRTLRLNEQEASAPVLCTVRWIGEAPAYGDVVRLHGEAQSLEAPRNPGEFDIAAWQRRKGVAMEIRAWSKADCAILGHSAGRWTGEWGIATRAWVKKNIETGLDAPEEAALIESMVLGMRGDTPAEMKAMFQRTGTLHLFAVSGLNVAMLALMVWYVLKPLGLPRGWACLISIPLLLIYAVATGMGASCVRATVMSVFLLAAPLANRPAVMLNSMAGAALVILAWDTNELFLPGFQLSFVLVLSIIGMADWIAKRIEPWLRPDAFIPKALWSYRQRGWMAVWKILCGTTGVTIAAWLGSLFFMAGYFHLFSPVAIVANAIAVPLAFVVLALGLMSLTVSVLIPPLLSVVNAANWFAAKALLFFVGWFAKIPHGHDYVEWPRLGPAPACEVMVLDTGEGAAIHVRAGNEDWLIDCGHQRDYPRILLPYLRSRGIDYLDGLILTHGDAAHNGGAEPLLDDFAPPWIADSPFRDQSPARRALHAVLAQRGEGRRFFQRGDVYPLSGGAVLRVLYPPPEVDRAKADDKALVCRIEAAGRRVLLMSDAGFFTEEWLLAHEPDLRADVLVKGWRAKDYSGTPDFLTTVQPRVMITSQPEFGMTPDKFAEWATPVAAKGVALFPQQYCGAVKIEVGRNGELRAEGWRR